MINSRDVLPVRVSIVIPCLNGSRYIRRLAATLEKVRSGTSEIVFIDDGSTDDSYEQFRRLCPYATSIRRENRGLGATRNEAVETARGEFIQLLDVDDTIEPGKLEEQWREVTNAGADVVYSDWRMITVSEFEEKPEPWQPAATKVEPVEALLGGWWFPPNAALIRRSAYLNAGGCDPSLGNTCEDFDLWVRLAIAGSRFHYAPGNFANYYRYSTVMSMSRKNAREFYKGVETILRKAIRLLEGRQELTSKRAKAAAQRLYQTARNVYAFDRSWYESLIADVFALDPRFSPHGSFLYRATAKAVGLRHAESLAITYRKLLKRGKR